ncbi:MAG: hypothetical protein U0Z70_10915 [Thermomicrobiales bacterium]|nr:hypothetical protein [Chloroflexia bacterium]
MKLSRFIMGSAVAVSLVGAGLLASPVAAQDECGVFISGGDVMNSTSISISADAGTSISDASAGSNNVATTSGGHGGDGAIDTASAGNGGVATSAANGGAISTGNINSGGNVGNAIVVGNTDCGAGAWEAPAEEAVAEEPAAEAEVVALPDTGVGGIDVSSILAAAGALGAAGASFGLRRR